jgi:hypothetical protein
MATSSLRASAAGRRAALAPVVQAWRRILVASDDIPEILRLDDLENKGWGYAARAKARGDIHMARRAQRLIKAAHERSMSAVMGKINQGRFGR